MSWGQEKDHPTHIFGDLFWLCVCPKLTTKKKDKHHPAISLHHIDLAFSLPSRIFNIPTYNLQPTNPTNQPTLPINPTQPNQPNQPNPSNNWNQQLTQTFWIFATQVVGVKWWIPFGIVHSTSPLCRDVVPGVSTKCTLVGTKLLVACWCGKSNPETLFFSNFSPGENQDDSGKTSVWRCISY